MAESEKKTRVTSVSKKKDTLLNSGKKPTITPVAKPTRKAPKVAPKKPIDKETVTITTPFLKKKTKSSQSSSGIKSPYAHEVETPVPPKAKKLSVVSRYIMTPKAFISLINFDGEEIAIQVARYGGVVIVAIGAVFSMHFATTQEARYLTSTSISNEAQVTATTPIEQSVTTSITETATTPKPQPAPLDVSMFRFINVPSSVVRGSVSVEFSVPQRSEIQSVALFAKNTETKQTFSLGFAKAGSTGVYTSLFYSNTVPNGTYTYEAKVKTPEKFFTITAENSFEVQNYVVTTKDGAVFKLSSTTAPINVPLAEEPAEDDRSNETVDPAIVIDRQEQEAIQEPEVYVPELAVSTVMVETLETNVLLKRLFFKQEATWVEFYALPDTSTTPLYIGRGYTLGDNVWQYVWNTSLVPSNDYEIYARAKTPAGIISSPKLLHTVPKKVAHAETTTLERDEDTTAETSPETTVDTPVSFETSITPTDFYQIDDKWFDDTRASSTLKDIVAVQNVAEKVEIPTADLEAFQRTMLPDLEALDAALASGDTDTARGIVERFGAEAKSVSERLAQSSDTYTKENIEASLIRIASARVLHTESAKRVISERQQSDATVDTDGDGVHDFDEINLFKTDPFNQDTDSDGFSDYEEVVGGYNPNNGAPDATIEKESPKLFGVAKSDILAVQAVTPVTVANEIPKAYISGVGLPNSIVTLYIFSTPIVITLKTDSQGNWNYLFDKELVDGDHEVYVGMTDGAGRLVAKSSPLAFVKTAEAYSPIGNQPLGLESGGSAPTDLYSPQSLLLVASISVVSIGLLLILIGHFMHYRRKENLVSNEVATV